jgi:hypothetical protein
MTLPIAARLLLAVLPAVRALPVLLLRPPAPPAAGRLLASGTAIAALRPGRPEEAVAAFEQAVAQR